MKMKWEIREHSNFGKSLFADNGTIQVGIPLEYGLRIGHFSLCGGENMFFEQPKDMVELATADGWRVRGGHRLWLAPEGKHDYYPDNDPISYEILENGIRIEQKEDPWLHVKKSITLTFGSDNGEDKHCLTVLHRIVNTGTEKFRMSVWPITSNAPGGIEHIPLKRYDGGASHRHRFSTWFYTNLGDARAKYTQDEITLTYMPVEEKYKLGVGHPLGRAWYEKDGVTFVLNFPVEEDKEYPDGNVSYETYLSKYTVEMESLSPLTEVLPGESVEHKEVWELRKSE